MHEHTVLENSMYIKRQLTLCLNTMPWRGIASVKIKFHVFYTLEYGTGQCYTLHDCILGEKDSGDHWTEGRMGLKFVLNVVKKRKSLPELSPQHPTLSKSLY
jgi:hypothetical protein